MRTRPASNQLTKIMNNNRRASRFLSLGSAHKDQRPKNKAKWTIHWHALIPQKSLTQKAFMELADKSEEQIHSKTQQEKLFPEAFFSHASALASGCVELLISPSDLCSVSLRQFATAALNHGCCRVCSMVNR